MGYWARYFGVFNNEKIMEIGVWLAFMTASWLISLSPGPGAVFSMSCGLQYGFKLGYLGVIGLILGLWTSLTIVAVGASTILLSSPMLFTAAKWLGAAYLFYLGWAQWRAPISSTHLRQDLGQFAIGRLIFKGWAVNATNPKGIVFMLAVLPQFINVSKPLLTQYIIVAMTFAITDAVVMAGYTGLAASLMGFLKSAERVRWMNRLFGGLFMLAALLIIGSQAKS
jgi:homoserine/homoserine lactone efflux protein